MIIRTSIVVLIALSVTACDAFTPRQRPVPKPTTTIDKLVAERKSPHGPVFAEMAPYTCMIGVCYETPPGIGDTATLQCGTSGDVGASGKTVLLGECKVL